MSSISLELSIIRRHLQRSNMIDDVWPFDVGTGIYRNVRVGIAWEWSSACRQTDTLTYWTPYQSDKTVMEQRGIRCFTAFYGTVEHSYAVTVGSAMKREGQWRHWSENGIPRDCRSCVVMSSRYICRNTLSWNNGHGPLRDRHYARMGALMRYSRATAQNHKGGEMKTTLRYDITRNVGKL